MPPYLSFSPFVQCLLKGKAWGCPGVVWVRGGHLIRRCGATFEGEEHVPESAGITRADLMDKGLIGPGSASRRAVLLQTLQLPEHLTTAGLLDALNLLLTRAEFDAL